MRRTKRMAATVLLLAATSTLASDINRVLDAVRRVESGNRTGRIIGDNGASIGPYQIQRAFWKDSRVPGRYEDCHDEKYARRVVLAYWKRYEPEAVKKGDAETLARLHNAGPGWRSKRAATNGYWRKVKGEMR